MVEFDDNVDEYSAGSDVTEFEDEKKKDVVGDKEKRGLSYAKMGVYLVVAFAAIGLGLTAYFLTQGEEEDDFDTQVRLHLNTVV